MSGVNPTGIGLFPPMSIGPLGSPGQVPIVLALLDPPDPAIGSQTMSLGLLQTTTTIGRSQIQALNTAPVQLTPTPAVGRYLFPLFVTINLRLPAGGTYSATQTASLVLANDFVNAFVTGLVVGPSTGAFTRRTTLAQPNPIFTKNESPTGVGFSSYTGQPILLRAGANVTGGDAADSAEITLVYWVIPQVPT